jgi:hypothetical protein
MSKDSVVTEVSLASLPTLPNSGLMQYGVVLVHSKSGRRIDVADSSFSRSAYPTPTAQEYGTAQNEGKVPGIRREGDQTLTHMVRKQWPTPMTTDFKASGSRCKGPDTKGNPGTSLTDATCRSGRPLQTTCTHGGECRWSLNPLFVAWLMGLPPIGVSGSMQSETLWYRWWSRMRTELFRIG